VFRSRPYGTLGTYGWGLEAAFEVDVIDSERRAGWSVMLLGRGRLLNVEEIAELRRCRRLEPWAVGARRLYVRIPWRTITGRFIGPPTDNGRERVPMAHQRGNGPWW
jgi:hypothetical protein